MSLVKSWTVKDLCGEGSWRWNDSTGLRLDASLDWYACHAQDVSDFGLLQARRVVLERQLIELLVDLEAPQAIGVGELAESAELFGAQRALAVRRLLPPRSYLDYSNAGPEPTAGFP